jgi:hypothetical protein
VVVDARACGQSVEAHPSLTPLVWAGAIPWLCGSVQDAHPLSMVAYVHVYTSLRLAECQAVFSKHMHGPYAERSRLLCWGGVVVKALLVTGSECCVSVFTSADCRLGPV